MLNGNYENIDSTFITPTENRYNGINEDNGIKPFEDSSLRKSVTASANARIVKLIKGGGNSNFIDLYNNMIKLAKSKSISMIRSSGGGSTFQFPISKENK